MLINKIKNFLISWNRISLNVFITALLTLFTAPALADFNRGYYVGGGAGTADIGVDDFSGTTVAMKLGELFGGYKYNNWLGLEARVGASLIEETYALDTIDEFGRTDLAEIKIDSYYSFYYRAELTNEIAKLYALAGVTSLSTSTQFDLSQVQADASGQSYGLGAGLYINEKMFFNVEFRTLISTKTDKFNIVGFNVDYRF